MCPLLARRVEHSTVLNDESRHFLGPFNLMFARKYDVDPYEFDAWKMPCPSQDDGFEPRINLWDMPRSYVCGLTLDQECFSEDDRRKLKSIAYVENFYMIPPGCFRIGGHQMVFDSIHAIKVETKSLIPEEPYIFGPEPFETYF